MEDNDGADPYIPGTPNVMSAADPDRAGRLLGKMQRVLGHDLPNQLVALQSLLQLLELEEGDRLGAAGRDSIARMQRVARTAFGQVRFLREMSRLGAPAAVGRVQVAVVVHELLRELPAELPRLAVTCRRLAELGMVAVDPRRLVAAVIEVSRLLLERAIDVPGIMELDGAAHAGGVALSGTMVWASLPPPPRSRLRENTAVILAEEMLAVCGASLSEVCDETERSRFTVQFEPAHG